MRATDDFDERRRARNRMVEDHAYVVDHFVRRFDRRGVAKDDLRQTAFLALVEAADRFDPDREVKFATFASRTIEGTLKRYFRDRTWLVRPPRSLQELHLRMRRANEELATELGRAPTLDELATHLEVEVDQIHQALEAGAAHNGVSIDAPTPGVDESESPDPGWIGAVDDGYELAEARAMVEELLRGLQPKQREMLHLRFTDELSQTEIADRYGISQSYLSRQVRQVLAELGESIGDLEPV